MFFKRKEAAALVAPDVQLGSQARAQSSARPTTAATGIAIGKWYLQQALQFEVSKQAQQAKLTKIAWRVATGLGAIAAVSIIGSMSLVQLKRPNPPAVLRVDTSSGRVDVLNVASDNHEIFDKRNDRADLRRYVQMRESYDWETIQDMFDSVKLMTADKERDRYVAMYSLPNAPQKILKDQYRVIARVGAITFVGSTAQIFFSKKLLPLNPSTPPKTEYWVATVSYRHDKLPEKASELEIDPTGFRVTSYTVDRDWTRVPDQAASAAAVQGAPDQPTLPTPSSTAKGGVS